MSESPENESVSTRHSAPNAAIVVALCIGALAIALRLAQYLHNRALWLDEAAMALQVVYKSPVELLGPLSWHQNAPIAFLLTVKYVTLLFGTSEYALRLVPIACGVLSVPLFAMLLWRVARTDRFRWEMVIAGLTFFAVSKHLIYYSSELRPYSTEVMITCLLLVVALWSQDGGQGKEKRLLLLLGVGLVAMWYSLASIFVLAAIGITFFCQSLHGRDTRRLALLAGIGVVWLVSFYFHAQIISENIEVRGLRPELEYWGIMNYAPFPPTSFDALKWYRTAFDLIFYIPVGLTYRGLGGFAFLAGCIVLWRRDKTLFFLVVLPIVIALAVSTTHSYPFRDRYTLFTAPLLMLAMAEGVALLADKKILKTRLIGALLLFLLVYQPAMHTARVFVQPRGGYEIKPLIAHMKKSWHDDDSVYLPLKSVPQFMYYLPRSDFDAISIPDELYYRRYELDFPGLSEGPVILEPLVSTGENLYSSEAFYKRWQAEHLPPLLERSHSVWILYEHDTGPPIDTPLGETDEIGKLLETIYSDGATLYRYARPDSPRLE